VIIPYYWLSLVLSVRAGVVPNMSDEVDKLRQNYADLPEAIDSPLSLSKANQPIQVYEGPCTLHTGSHERRGTGRFTFEWLPSPRVQFDAAIDASAALEDLDDVVVELPNFERSEAFVTNTAGWFGTSDPAIRGFLKGELRPVAQASFTGHHHFHLTNFHNFIGSPVRAAGGELGAGARRLTLPANDGHVIIDQAVAWSQLVRQTTSLGGFAISHVGRVIGNDGALVDDETASTLQQALRYFLGFARSFWVGPILPYRDGKRAQDVRYAPWVLTPWRSVRSWFPVHQANQAASAFVEFVELYKDEDWNEPLRHAVGWFVDANLAPNLETSVATAQVALELLAWLTLVDRLGHCTDERFRKARTDDNLRAFLSACRVPYDYPAHLTNLPEASSIWGAGDAAGAFVCVRNAIVHPTAKKRKGLRKLGRLGKLEAKEVGLAFIELALLSILKYRGPFHDRTRREGYVGDSQTVPWVEAAGS